MFVGYEAGSKAYRCHDPARRRVIITRGVVFDEASQWSWEVGNTEPEHNDLEPFTVEYQGVPDPGDRSSRCRTTHTFTSTKSGRSCRGTIVGTQRTCLTAHVT